MKSRIIRPGRLCPFAVALALVTLASRPGHSTSLIRASVEELSARNESVVMGEVIDAVSYWNQDKTFILTDVTLASEPAIKGQSELFETVTLLGGTVDGLTTLIIGGAELVPGRSYVLFLGHRDLPGAPGAWSVPDHCQGTFDLVGPKGRQRAISQANRHPLVADAMGRSDAPGGAEGLLLDELIARVRTAGGAR